jgi:hypothetical protein
MPVAFALLVRASWAPLLVFLVHVFISRVLNAYLLFPPVDIPMHFVGGVAMAYFLSICFAALPDIDASPRLRSLAQTAFVVMGTSTASVFWEFAEFFSDTFFGTRAQLGLEDTLFDMALGIVGSLCYAALALRHGALRETMSSPAARRLGRQFLSAGHGTRDQAGSS